MIMEWLLSGLCVLFIGLCLSAAVSDVQKLTISNKTNLTIVGMFIPAALLGFLTGVFPLALIGGHLLAAIIAFLVGFALFNFGIFGGGDAKLIPAAMLWLGPSAAFPFAFYTALFGGLCALIVLMVSKWVPVEAIPGPVKGPFASEDGKPKVPYGVGITAGVLLSAPSTPLFHGLVNQISLIG